jgi:hypothetical protein
MSKIEVDAIEPQSGTSLTVGASGDTITIPSGATLDASNATVTYPAGSITDAAISSTAAIQQSKILGSPGFRNIIINGDMSIAQRGTSASITTSGYRTVDRFNMPINLMGTFTVSQSTDTPTGQGFRTSTKYDCTTADASPAANDFIRFEQYVEAQNLQYLKFGTASASSLTLSFWVKSNKTGTYIAELRNFDGGRTICNSYTINASNTWEKKIITVAGDTDGSGAFNNDNGLGLACIFWLGAGSDFTSGTLATDWEATTSANRAVGQVNLADDTANEWYITGVQLEAGTTASDFEFLPVDVDLQRCQRYFVQFGKNQGVGEATGDSYAFGITNDDDLNSFILIPLPVRMRTAPTSITQTGTASDYRIRTYLSDTCTDVPVFSDATPLNVRVVFKNSGHGFGTAVMVQGQINDANSFIGVDAEI